MEPVFETLFSAIVAQLAAVDGLKHIDIDFGQLEGYQAGYRPAVGLPCALIDFDEFQWEDLPDGGQSGEGMVVVRIGYPPYTPSSNVATASQRSKALEYFGIERAVYKSLHGFSGGSFDALRRRTSDTEKRNDDIRVRILRFTTAVLDAGAITPTVNIARPTPVVGGDMVNE